MPRQIFLFSPIYDFTAESVTKQLLDLDRESNEEITMFINSPGGSVIAMFAIIDIMNAVKSPVRTIVMGQAASAAAIIASSGNKRLMTESSRFMIHEVWTLMGGSVSEIDEDLKQMTKEQDKLIAILSKNTGKTADQIKSAIKKTNKFLDANESKRFGLVDSIIKKDSAQVLKLSEGINGEGFEVNEEKKEIQLLRTGSFNHPDYGKLNITSEILEQLKHNYEENIRGIDISIDYTHDNETGESPAAFWIKSLEIKNKDDGQALFAIGEFTPKGKKAISEKEFKYASADFVINYSTESGEQIPYVLRGGTLTNRPFIKEMNPIKLSETKQQKKEIKLMDKEAMMNALKDEHGIDVTSLESSIQSKDSEIEGLQNKIKELNELPAKKDEEISELKQKVLDMVNEINEKEKISVYENLISEGKIVPAQKENVLKTFDSAKAMEEFYKEAKPVVNLKTQGEDANGNNELTPTEQSLVEKGILSKEDILKHKK